MASHLYRTRALLQIPRCIPTLVARGQATQTPPTAGQGIPPAGNYNSATRPPVNSNTTGSKSPPPPFGDPAANQPFMNTTMGKSVVVGAVVISAYIGYRLLSSNKAETKDPKDKKDGKDQKTPKTSENAKAGGGGSQQGGGAQKSFFSYFPNHLSIPAHIINSVLLSIFRILSFSYIFYFQFKQYLLIFYFHLSHI